MFSFLHRHDKISDKAEDDTTSAVKAAANDTAVDNNNNTSPAPATEPDTHDDATDISDESLTPSTATDDMCDDASSQSDTDEHIAETEDNIRDAVAQDTESICDDNIDDTAIDVSTCENANTHNTAADSNICDDAFDTSDEQHDEQEDTHDISDSVAQVEAKDDIYAALRFECGNDMSVTIDDESDTVTISHGNAGDESDDEHDAERPAGRHYIDADAILLGDEPARYHGFMTYGRGDADEIADRCPASELDFDAILSDYDRADHRMVRDVLDGLYGSMSSNGELSSGDPRPFPVYGGAAMPLNNWSWQDVMSVRKHIAHMPLPVVTDEPNVPAGVKAGDADNAKDDKTSASSSTEEASGVPFADDDIASGRQQHGRIGRHFKDVDTNASDYDERDGAGTALVDCGNGYFMYVSGDGSDVPHRNAQNATSRRDDANCAVDTNGTYHTNDSNNAVDARRGNAISNGMSDAVKIGCIAALVIARRIGMRSGR